MIVGAGMDSFAFRRPDLVDRIDVFEIDHPRGQHKKLGRTRQAGLPALPRRHFVAADLAAVSVVDAFADSPFDSSLPTLFSMLGVSYFLTLDALAKTDRSIASSSPRGARIVIDYLLDEVSCDQRDDVLRRALLGLVRDCGEPIPSACSPGDVETLFAREGFEPVENFALAELEPALRTERGRLLFRVQDIFGLGAFRGAPLEESHRIRESHASADLRS